MTACLYHGDYGPANPLFASRQDNARWLRQGARNGDEAQAILRHNLHGETVAWCDQGYAWAEQGVVGWLLVAALLFVVLPYLVTRLSRPVKAALRRRTAKCRPDDPAPLNAA